MLVNLRWTVYLSILTSGTVDALIFTIPSKTTTPGTFEVTYVSEASDPAGVMAFWLGHQTGAGGFFNAGFNISHVSSPTKYGVFIPDSAGDGQLWAVSAGPGDSSLPHGFFAESDVFTINPTDDIANTPTLTWALTSQKSPTETKTQAPSSTTTSQADEPSSITIGGMSSSQAASSTLSSSGPIGPIFTSALFSSTTVSILPKSSDGSLVGASHSRASSSRFAGLIAGVTIGALSFILVTSLLFYLRRRRRSKQDHEPRAFDLEPALTSVPYSDASPVRATLGFDTLSPNRRGKSDSQPTIPTRSVSRSPSYATTLTSTPSIGSRAAVLRQAYLSNQLAAVQAQLAALQTAPNDNPVQTATSTSDSVLLRQQNVALHARIQVLETQLQSQWALGLSDEPPPGYME